MSTGDWLEVIVGAWALGSMLAGVTLGRLLGRARRGQSTPHESGDHEGES